MKDADQQNTQIKNQVEQLEQNNKAKQVLINELLRATYGLAQGLEGKGPLVSYNIGVNPEFVFPEDLKNIPKDDGLMKYIANNFIT